jgi:hypothetical protein
VQLRLTRRALEDLGLDVAARCRLLATSYADAHEVVRAFVDIRSQDPDGQERTVLPVTKAPVWNLHHGRHRGLTWYDQDADVVWLLGIGWHESGSRDDAYAVLKDRDVAGTLMPTEADYLDLEASPEENLSFVAHVAEEAPALVAQAREQPGTEVRAVIAERLGVGLVVELVVMPGEHESLEEIWIGFEMPPLAGHVKLPPQPQWIQIVVAALLPFGASLNHAQYGGDFPRPGGSRPNEIVVVWRSF